MRFGRTLMSFIGLTVLLLSGELWLRDGFAARESQIVFTSSRDGNSEIYVMDSDGRKQKRLTANQADDGSPVWSPDGNKISFVSNRNGGFIQIYVMDADGKNPTRLTEGVWDSNPSWSPDGQKIAFTSRQNGMAAHIAVMDADGNNLVKLEDSAAEPSWSPDGQQLAFMSWRDRSDEIYVIDADGQGLKRVTHDLAAKGGPSWSPDGKRIAYYALHDGFHHIYVVGADGGNRQRLTHNQAHHGDPAWSPDGQTIAFVSSKPIDLGVREKIHLMTGDGEYLRQLSDIHNAADVHPDWYAPAGRVVSSTASQITTWGKLKKIASNLRQFEPTLMRSDD